MNTNALVYYWFYKPFQTLCQFSPEGDKQTLAHYFPNIPKDVYPVGRLDYDSEGLILLTNDKQITHQLLHPKFDHSKTYWAQVDGSIDHKAIQQLCKGVTIAVNQKQYTTKPALVTIIDTPELPERNPPIRYRKNIPTSWIALTITEGKNRQVRKMTAAVGFPTLRLIRHSIGDYNINGLLPGQFITTHHVDKKKLFASIKVEKIKSQGKE